jgi:hypothetical protein
VEAVDPYSDVGDYEDGDESMPDDSGNGSGSQSDNGHKNTKSGSGNGTKSAATNKSHHATNNRPVPAAKTTNTGVSVHEPPENKSTSTNLRKDAAILKKEVLTKNGVEDVKTQQHGPRSLIKRSTEWGKLIVWSLMILFPLAFIGKVSSLQIFHTTNFLI